MKTWLFILTFISSFSSLCGQSLFLESIEQESKDTSKIAPSVSGNETEKRFFFFGTTSVNTTEELLNTFQGSQKFQFLARLIPQKARIVNDTLSKSLITKPGLDFSFGVNAFNLKPSSVSVDSVDFVSLMFPETGNFGLMMNAAFHWGMIREEGINHRFSSEISYCLRQNSVKEVYIHDSEGQVLSGPETVSFSVLNFNIMPIRYNFNIHNDKDFNLDFNIGFYFNWFNIPNEDVTNFNKLYPTDAPLFPKAEKSSISSYGAKVACSINGFVVFADLRQNTRTDNLLDSNPYKGFVFNTGIAQNINIFGK